MVDDHGWMNLTCQGNKLVETSHLECLAKRGGNYACTTAYRRVGTLALFGDSHDARVAELVDAHDSGSCPSNGVQVQLLPRAPSTLPIRFKHFRQLVQKRQVCHIIKIQRSMPVSVPVWFLSRLLPTKNIPRSKTDLVNLSGGCGTYYARVTVKDPNGIRRDRRFALEASNLSELVLGKELGNLPLDDCKKALKEDFQPITDVRASQEYRNDIAFNLFLKACNKIAGKPFSYLPGAVFENVDGTSLIKSQQNV